MKKESLWIAVFVTAIIMFLAGSTWSQTAFRTYDEMNKERTAINGEITDLGLIEAGINIRLKQLKAEKEAISQEHSLLKPAFTEWAARKMDYDRKCAGQNFHRDNPQEMEVEKGCRQEKAWLESTNQSLKDRKTKNDQRETAYKNDLTQLKIDNAAYLTRKEAAIARKNNWQTGKEQFIRRTAQDAVYTFKDQGLRDWVVSNVNFSINKDPGQQDMLSPWVGANSQLIFTDQFLKEEAAMQENLMAFESGKLFMVLMRDKVLKNGQTLELWFSDYSAKHNSMIWSMREVKHNNVGLSSLGDIDKESLFGYVFRAEVFELGRPTDPKLQMEWEASLREFRGVICQILKQSSN